MTTDEAATDEVGSEYRVVLDRAGTRTPTHPVRDEIRLLSPDFYADFHNLTSWMRSNAPLYWDDSTGIWGAASFELVSTMSRDWHTFCSSEGSRPDSSVPSMINFDPPEHTRRRRMVSAGFTLRQVDNHEPYLRQKVGELIDSVIDRGECDVVADLATPLPMYMIGQLMGLPEADHAKLLHWSDLFATGGDELQPQIEQAVREYWEYAMDKITTRRGAAGDDLISLIVNADDETGPLTDVDIVMETMLVLVGGDETTRHVISGGLAALIQHPDQLAALRADPSLMPAAVEEMLRWTSPIRNMNRTATRDVEIGGQTVREGDRLLLLYPSANRDETVFERADQFDIFRTPTPHVAFGGLGRHHCLGAPLARLELRVLFEELLARLDNLCLAPHATLPERRGNFVLGLTELPITFTSA